MEPFNRALREEGADVMINGRRRDHGAERAHLEIFESGSPVKCQPLAYWTFRVRSYSHMASVRYCCVHIG